MSVRKILERVAPDGLFGGLKQAWECCGTVLDPGGASLSPIIVRRKVREAYHLLAVKSPEPGE